MVAPTGLPLVGNIALSGPAASLGDVFNRGSPTAIFNYNYIIPSPLLGNEYQAGY